jgi:hypothetical protein
VSAGELLRRARGHALRLGRITVEDAAELCAVFAQVASLQVKDAASGLGCRLTRWIERGRCSVGGRR